MAKRPAAPVSASVALPFIDDHHVQVDAAAVDVWAALVHVLPRSFGGRGKTTFARAIGCDQVRHDGHFPGVGAHLVGFHVAIADGPRNLVLQGRHRYAAYELAFRLEPEGDGTRLSASTYAHFPGLTGRLYRTAVIGTRGHVVVVRRMLHAVRRRAEREAQVGPPSDPAG